MDPDVTLALLRKAVAEFDAMSWETDNDARAMAAHDAVEHARALDEWLSKGGYLPKDWAKGRE